jgi:type IV secretory pathway VirB2 component (pilin)
MGIDSAISLADPGRSETLGVAVAWIEGMLLGSIALIVATLAVAGLGFMMLTGRIEIRRGMTVIVGAFLLFGSPVIAQAIRSLTVGSGSDPSVRTEPQPPLTAPEPPPPIPINADPYAGASVPVR